MHILMTGSNGFIGKKISNILRKKEISFTKINLRTLFFEDLDQKKIDNYLKKKIKKKKKIFLVHLGWGKIGYPWSGYHIKKNYVKTQILFNFANKNKFKKVLFCGSMNEYGNRNGALRELMKPIALSTKYSISKYLSTEYGLRLFKNSLTKFYCIRPSYVYGYDQRKGTAISTLIDSIKKKIPINLTHCKIFRDYVFVEDVAKAFYLLLTSKSNSYGIFNVGSGQITTLRHLIEKIAYLSGFEKKFLNFGFLKTKKEQPHPKCFMNNSKLFKVLKWRPSNNLDRGCIKILKYHKIKIINKHHA
jgi:nucleoside-diphosphate-sugar epimerase